ncbi:YtpR family tRNA-binding protein [Aureibacillus halotolerans]|uniref:tRNA-binding protein n=1 Tax=Aureibacillus halotolerans TaxID=1508390 RepID=A0A4R6U7P9_9BACI|nr:DUF4479 family protein [Aureibacillus halotolerans]TDQ39074.1 tRNA-binding protein [Aureibacillus halotolerans]
MNAYYNEIGIGDVLLLVIKESETEETTVERRGDVAVLKNAETKETIGWNLFHVSKQLHLTGNGRIDLQEAQVDTLQSLLKKEGFDEVLPKASAAFVIGHVESCEKHPNADKLNICQVNVGSETLQIVCGAANIAANQTVVVAQVGAIMPGGMLITSSDLRGVASSGMICSARELALPNADNEKGILVLDGEKYKAGDVYTVRK